MPLERVIVDGANVAYMELSHDGKPKVSNLIAMCTALEEQGYEPTVIVDASLRYEISDPSSWRRCSMIVIGDRHRPGRMRTISS